MVGAAAAWTPASLGSTEEPVPGIPCLPGGPRFLSKRECPLELRLPFLPLTPEQMGFMLGSLLHVQNFPPEARGHCVQKGVRCPWEPPQGGLAGERAWLEFKDATLGEQDVLKLSFLLLDRVSTINSRYWAFFCLFWMCPCIQFTLTHL